MFTYGQIRLVSYYDVIASVYYFVTSRYRSLFLHSRDNDVQHWDVVAMSVIYLTTDWPVVVNKIPSLRTAFHVMHDFCTIL